MRLDHLLSKERLTPTNPDPLGAFGVGGVVEASSSQRSWYWLFPLLSLALDGPATGRWRGPCGPRVVVEGRTPCWVLREQACCLGFSGCQTRPYPGLSPSLLLHRPWVVVGGVGVGFGRWGLWGWSLVENCTVDASIFVVKLSRADGGCLGTRSR